MKAIFSILIDHRAAKNRQRFNFGVLYPREYCDRELGSDSWETVTECLVQGTLSITVGKRKCDSYTWWDGRSWLQWVSSQPALFACEDSFNHTRQEALERHVSTPPCGMESITAVPYRQQFLFTAAEDSETLQGELQLAALQLADEQLFKLSLRIQNTASLETATDLSRDQVLSRSLVSVHSILHASGGAFVSSFDPPDYLKPAAAGCHNIGAWPVLAGDEGQRDLILSAPIILYDYPQIAPESAGDLFDGTEVDEILALRILTMTDAEKLEVRNGDDSARRILERTEMLPPEHFQKLHGAFRGLRVSPGGAAMNEWEWQLLEDKPALEQVTVAGVKFAIGDHVRLHPRNGGDIMDFALAGKIGIIESIEQDYEGKVQVAIVMDEDPGKDLGMLRQPGHRFFFSPEEIESL